MKMKRLGLFALTSFLSLASAFAGEMGFKFQEEASGGLQFRLIGQDLCDASNTPGSFSIEIGSISSDRRFMRNEQYVSANGNSSWKIAKACTINQELRQNLLQPGRALMVQTYGSYGQNLEKFYLVVPCYKDSNFVVKEYRGYTSISEVTATVCEAEGSDVAVIKDPVETETVVITPPVVQQPVQSCDARLAVSTTNNSLLDVRVLCSLQDTLNVMISETDTQNAQPLTYKVVGANVLTYVGSVRRNPRKSSRYNIEMYSNNHSRTFYANSGLISKDATNDYALEMNLMTPLSINARETKWAVGKGSDFDAVLRVHVADRDIETSNKTKSILVQLYETTDGRNSLIDERRVSTDEAVKFDLFGQYDVPYMWGESVWDNAYVLRGGTNTFVIRVFEAYSTSRYKDSETIRIKLPNY